MEVGDFYPVPCPPKLSSLSADAKKRLGLHLPLTLLSYSTDHPPYSWGTTELLESCLWCLPSHILSRLIWLLYCLGLVAPDIAECKEGAPGNRQHPVSRLSQRGVIRQTILVAAVLLIAFFGRIPAKALGLVPPRSWTQTWETLSILLAAILGLPPWVRVPRRLAVPAPSKDDYAILPISKSERWWFAAVGIGAGVSEELLYRGFLIYYLWVWLPGLDWTQRTIVSSLVFGLGHLYQGWKGSLGTTAYGFCFPRFYTGARGVFLPRRRHPAAGPHEFGRFSPPHGRGFSHKNTAAPSPPPPTKTRPTTNDALRSFRPARQILFLLRRELVDLDADRLQLQLGDALVEIIGNFVDLLLQRLVSS